MGRIDQGDAIQIAAISLMFLLAGYLFGYYMREAREAAKRVAVLRRRQPKEEPKSAILEPELTASERVLREQEELLERINRPSGV